MNEWEKKKLQELMQEDNFEKIHDEVEKQLIYGLRWQGIYEHQKDPECYTHDNLGLRRVEELGPRRDGAYGYEIQKAMDQVGVSAEFDLNSKKRKAKDFLNNLLGRTFYGYTWLRKKLGMPLESFMMRPAYARWFNQCLGFINPGGLVWAKEGTYTIETTLAQPALVALKGASWATILTAKNALNDNIIENKTPASGDQDMLLADFCIDGNKANNTSGNGISFSWCGRSALRHLFIKNTEGNCISWVKGAAGTWYGVNDLSDLLLWSPNDRGIYMDSLADCRIYSVEALGSGGTLDTILLSAGGPYHLVLVRPNYGNRCGITFSACAEVLAESVWCDANQQHGINIEGDSSRIILVNCISKNNSQAGAGTYSGLRIYDALHVIVIGGHFFDNQGTKTQKYGIFADESGAGKTDYLIVHDCDCDLNQDATYDIYINAPQAADNRDVTHNFGRTYLAA